MIQLKRKRSDSDDEDANPLFSANVSNFPARNDSLASQITRTLISSRTRKRHRDNRPSESEVHQQTLSLLFSAQKNLLPGSNDQLYQKLNITPSLPPSRNPIKQSSLHSYWSTLSTGFLPCRDELSPNNTLYVEPGTTLYFPDIKCEDCDAILEADGERLDGQLYGECLACVNCKRYVCHACSITNLGIDRKCLICFGKN